MSDKLGPIALLPAEARSPFLPGVSETSERTQQRVDEEVERIIEAAQAEVIELLTQHRDKLDALAQALLASETLDEAEAYAAAGVARVGVTPAPHPGEPRRASPP